MKNFNKALAIATLSAVLVSGCATTGGFMSSPAPTNESVEQKQLRQTNNRQAATKGFLGGCGVGALTGLLSGKRDGGKNAIAGCLAGGVIGGSVAWYQSNQRQLADAYKLAEQARAAGVKADVRERTVRVKNQQTGQVEDVKALDRLTIELPAGMLSKRSVEVKELLRKSAVMADQSKDAVVITTTASSADRAFIESELNRSLSVGGKTTLAFKEGAPARLELSPVPNLQ